VEIRQVSLEDCADASGTVVVIDVLRAFSTAAYAFAAGADEILLVSKVEEALALRARNPGLLAMGEVEGLKPEDFDFGNSPYEISRLDFTGRRLIQRTSAGTQGVVRSTQAETLLASSFVCARATAEFIRHLAPDCVTFVITGLGSDGWGDEDAACADYIEALLWRETIDIRKFVDRVRKSPPGRAFAAPDLSEMLAFDLEYCLNVDCFDFAMQVDRRDGSLILRSVYP
jgi:2-phosphosulfolactate phosphatase